MFGHNWVGFVRVRVDTGQVCSGYPKLSELNFMKTKLNRTLESPKESKSFCTPPEIKRYAMFMGLSSSVLGLRKHQRVKQTHNVKTFIL